MAAQPLPEDILRQLQKDSLSPFYLFYGESEFRLEKILTRIRETVIPEGERDFNLHVFYGDEIKSNVGEVIDTARSFPFMGQRRLIILRRTENIPVAALEGFLPYFENPMETSCLVLVSQKPDFRKKFYKTIRSMGAAVEFKNLYENQVVPWIMKTAKDMGLIIDTRACAYLQQMVGNRLRDLYSELEKIQIRYGSMAIGIEEVRQLAVYSRSFTIFELMDHVSQKRVSDAISVLRRFMEEEGRDASLGIMGMLIRQMRLLWQSKPILERGGNASDLSKALQLHPYAAKGIQKQARNWQSDALKRAFDILYEADGLIKSGSDGQLVLENVVMNLCG